MGKDRILVVDDDPDNRAMIGHFLSNWGYDVDDAKNGKVALETVSRSRPERAPTLSGSSDPTVRSRLVGSKRAPERGGRRPSRARARRRGAPPRAPRPRALETEE